MSPRDNKYWIPINGDGTEAWITDDQFNVALRWLRFISPVPFEAVHKTADDYYMTDRLCSDQLAALGVLNETKDGYGYILKPQARQHLEQHQRGEG